MDNHDIARIFSKTAKMLEFQNASSYKIKAYNRASYRIKNLKEDINNLHEDDRLDSIPGVGKSFKNKIVDILNTGTFSEYEKIRQEIPVNIEELMAIPGMGPRITQFLYKRLGIRTIDDLKEAARTHRIRRLPNMGAIKEERILNAIKRYEKRGADRILLETARQVADDIKSILETIPYTKVSVVGSVRRQKETVNNINLIVTTDYPKDVINCFTRIKGVQTILNKADKWVSIIYNGGIPVDLQIVDDDYFGPTQIHLTGSKKHNIHLQQIASSMNLHLSKFGLINLEDGNKLTSKTENDIYQKMGLDYIPPELREDRGEIESAFNGALPELVTADDIKGDLHIHSNWSDGKSTIQQIADNARSLGYEYVAICDHSKSRANASGLSEGQLLRRMDEIEKINSRYDDFRILAGTECDIKANASLDYNSNILEKMDIVIAAIHTGFDEDKKTITKRIVRALENEYVNVLAHPTGRRLGERAEYDVDMDKLMETAKRNNKILEINGSPSRLDLNDINAKTAKEMGIPLVINTDAHWTHDMSRNMKTGVNVARRGWLEPKDVVNTQNLDDFCSFMGID
ncbi:PHP domain protein [Methanohalobium evestigatum Z-7303]|uniref:DNA-directed DNA polymerase n=1 Tax=Methanohalobium evestigatum (strain ATCC BAA-1072 / DSM 3721 / NBRC 107634 / OCM 161 / Z-7303) TaxID=644295 RepID=D7E7H2_METEZ|nr:DNA polymerase/3'-5' exonuclease PolX [Methanohalobium evestigatum]ADI73921.1 PHP domain protein [Methanohalobium evestigatum Z-7303]